MVGIKGDEDVVEEIDGSQRVLTRSLQNWHTHLAMQLNARDFSDGYPLHRWLNEAIFPTEARITPEYVRVGTSAAATEMIRTGSTFAADMYFFPAVTGDVLTNAGLRGLIGGPVSDAALPSHDDAESALAELDQLLAQNKQEDLVQYAIATHSVYLCSKETLQRASDLAQRRNGRLHIHVSETRKEVADCKQVWVVSSRISGFNRLHSTWNCICSRVLGQKERDPYDGRTECHCCTLSIIQHETCMRWYAFLPTVS